jgi:hypothetical protein
MFFQLFINVFRERIIEDWIQGETAFWVKKGSMKVGDGNHRLMAIQQIIEESEKEDLSPEKKEKLMDCVKRVQKVAVVYFPPKWSDEFITTICMVQNAKDASTVR